MLRTLVLIAAVVASPITIRDVDGRAWTLLQPPGSQLDLLFFISPDCPISNRYAPEIQRVCADYGSRGARCFAVYPDAIDDAAIARHRREYGFGASIPAIIDRDHALVRAVGPRVTPEAAMYSSFGRQYKGRIDDLYLDVGRSRRTPVVRDLRRALDAVLAGRTPSVTETEAVGCFIQNP